MESAKPVSINSISNPRRPEDSAPRNLSPNKKTEAIMPRLVFSLRSNSSRHSAGGKNFIGGCKSMWVLAKPGGHPNKLDSHGMAGTHQPATDSDGSSAIHGLNIGTIVIHKYEVYVCALHNQKIVIGL